MESCCHPLQGCSLGFALISPNLLLWLEVTRKERGRKAALLANKRQLLTVNKNAAMQHVLRLEGGLKKLTIPTNSKDKKECGLYVVLEVKNTDRIIELHDITYLLCLVYLFLTKNHGGFFLFLFYVLGISSSQNPRGTQCLALNIHQIQFAF